MSFQIKITTFKDDDVPPLLIGSFTEFVNFSDDLLVTEKNENGKKTIKVTGNVTVTSENWELFEYYDYTYEDAGIYVDLYKNGIFFIRNIGRLKKIDRINKIAVVEIVSTRDYYSSILDNDKKYNVLDITQRYTVIYKKHKSKHTFSTFETVTFFMIKDSFNFWLPDLSDYIESIVNDEFKTAYHIYFAYSSHDCSAGTITLDVVIYWAQWIAVGVYNGSTKIYPAGSGWYYLDDTIIGGITYPRFKKKIKPISDISYGSVDDSNTCNLGVTKYAFYEKITWSLPADNDITYSRAIKFEDLITYLFERNAVYSDANSFGYKTYDGLSEYTTGLTKSFENLMVIALTDAIPTINMEEPLSPQTVLDVKITDVLSFLEERGFYWYIEEISGVKYFRIKLNIQKTLGTGNPDISNEFFGSSEFEIKKAKKGKINNDTTSGGWEFSFPYWDFYETSEKQITSVADNGIYTDIDNVVDGDFPNDDVEKFILVACDFDGTNYIVRQTAGVFSQLPNVNNNELSFSYLLNNTIYDLPRNHSYLNNTESRLEKRAQIKCYISNNYEFNFDNYVKIGNENFEIEEKKYKLDEFAELILKK